MMNHTKGFKYHSETGIVSEFISQPEETFSLPENSEFFTWIKYDEKYVEYEEQSVKKAKWILIINEKEICNLDVLELGSVYKRETNSLLPKINWTPDSPFKISDYVFDYNSNNWVSPILENNTIKIWDIEEQKYK
jgi:hypothetical protein